MQERTPEYRKGDQEYYADQPEDLKPLQSLRGWELGPEYPDVRGWSLFDRDEKKIGDIDDFLVNTRNGEIIFAVATYGGAMGIGGKKTLIPLDKLDLETKHERAFVDVTEAQLRDVPEFDKDTHDYRGFHDFWGGRVTERRERELEERQLNEERERRIREEELAAESHQKEREHGEAARRERYARDKVYATKPEGEREKEVEPEPIVLREGETLRIPVVGERVVGEVVVGPEDTKVEDSEDYVDEEEEHTEETRRRTGR